MEKKKNILQSINRFYAANLSGDDTQAALVQAVTNRAEAAYTLRTTGVPCIPVASSAVGAAAGAGWIAPVFGLVPPGWFTRMRRRPRFRRCSGRGA